MTCSRTRVYPSRVMDWSSPWLWIPVLTVGIGLAIGIRIYNRVTRKKLITKFVRTSRFERVKEKPFSRDESKLLPLFQRGNSGRFVDVLRDDSGMLLFDYRYRFGMPGVASVIYTQTVAALPVVDGSIPDFQLAPKQFLDKVGTRLGVKAISLKAFPNFSAQRWLRGIDTFAVENKFTHVAPIIEQLDPTAQWSIDKCGNWILVYRHASTVSPSQLSGFAEFARKIAQVLVQPT